MTPHWTEVAEEFIFTPESDSTMRMALEIIRLREHLQELKDDYCFEVDIEKNRDEWQAYAGKLREELETIAMDTGCPEHGILKDACDAAIARKALKIPQPGELK